MYTGKIDHRFSDKVSLMRASIFTTRPTSPARTTLFPGPMSRTVHRQWRLPARSPRPRAGAEQHLAAEQQHRGHTALRLDEVPRRRHAVDRLRSRARSGFNQHSARDPDQEVPESSTSPTTTSSARSIRSDRNWNSWSANGAVSKLVGRHTFKAGVDYREYRQRNAVVSGRCRQLRVRSPLHLV